MAIRVHLAKWITRVARLIDALSIMIMQTDDLIAYTRDSYNRPEIRTYWTGSKKTGEGLNTDEQRLLDCIPSQTGKSLVLGLGGGREAIVLARREFTVTGVDFVPEAVERARSVMAAEGFSLEGVVGEISSMQFPAGPFDLVWLSKAMYSAVPTKERRIRLLRRIRRVMGPEGAVVCQYYIASPPVRYSARVEKIRRMFAVLVRGNTAYETGDFMRQNFEFLHAFSSESDLDIECRAGGFITVYRQLDDPQGWGGRILKKAHHDLV